MRRSATLRRNATLKTKVFPRSVYIIDRYKDYAKHEQRPHQISTNLVFSGLQILTNSVCKVVRYIVFYTDILVCKIVFYIDIILGQELSC